MTDIIVLDAHAHEWTRDMPHVADFRYRLDYDFTPEQSLKVLDEHGIHAGFLAAATPFGDYNDYTIAALRSSPRLRGSLIVNPNVERHAPDQMDANAAASRH